LPEKEPVRVVLPWPSATIKTVSAVHLNWSRGTVVI
jgi:hypothetical protein